MQQVLLGWIKKLERQQNPMLGKKERKEGRKEERKEDTWRDVLRNINQNAVCPTGQ